jgi:HlyD family secretion protein
MGLGKVLAISTVTLTVLAGAGFAVYKSPVGKRFMGAGKNFEDMGTPVRLEAASRGDIKRTVSAPGSIEPRTNVQISSQVSAEVLALPFREGDRVNAGDVVVRLDPQNLVAALDSAKAGLKRQQAALKGSEAALINARLQYERLQSLLETGDATQSEFDSAEASFLQAQANKASIEASIEEAQARIDEAEKDLDNINITSSIDGVITTLNTEVGETVIVGTTNNPGSIIMEIADLSEMLLNAAVDETNIAPVRVGQAATIYINAYSEREYTGTVRRIGLKRVVSSDGTGTFNVEIPIDLPEGETLYTGLTASTDIAVENFYDAIIVPSQSVLDRRVEDLPVEIRSNELIEPGKTFARVVYTVVDGKTVATPVTTGASNLTHTVITAGLEEGQQVVSGPYRVLVTLRHDMRVKDMDKMGEDGQGKSRAAKDQTNDQAADEDASPDETADESTEESTDDNADDTQNEESAEESDTENDS